MNDMNEEQYEQVLKYMETAHEDNFEAASVILQQHNFDLQVSQQSFSKHFMLNSTKHNPEIEDKMPLE